MYKTQERNTPRRIYTLTERDENRPTLHKNTSFLAGSHEPTLCYNELLTTELRYIHTYARRGDAARRTRVQESATKPKLVRPGEARRGGAARHR